MKTEITTSKVATSQCDGCNQKLEIRGDFHYKNGKPWMMCTTKELEENTSSK